MEIKPATINPTKPVEIPEGFALQSFSFRAQQATDIDGNPVVDEKGNKVMVEKPAFKALIPVVTNDSLVSLFNDATKAPAILSFCIDLLNQSIIDNTRVQINTLLKDGKELAQSLLNVKALDIYAIATEPRSIGRGIPQEIWDSFKVDYIQFMSVDNKHQSSGGADTVAKEIADSRLSKVRTSPELLNKIKGFLDTFISTISEDKQSLYLPIYEDMTKKIAEYSETAVSAFASKMD